MLLSASPKEVARCNKMIIPCDILTPPEQPTAPFASVLTVHVQLQLGLDVRCAEFTDTATASPEMPVVRYKIYGSFIY